MNQQATSDVRAGGGRIQWEAGWLAAVFGGTSWLVVGAVVLAWNGHVLGSAVSASSWLLIVGLACWLWVRRDRIDPFDAIAVVLIVFSVVMPIVWYVCWDAPMNQRITSLHWIRGLRAAAACSMAPLILLCLFIRERVACRET